MNIDQNKIQFLPVQNQILNDGQVPLAARLNLDFTAQTHYDLDMQAVQAQNRFDRCQSIFLDNSAGGAPLVVTFKSSGMVISLKAGFQGWFNVISPNPILISFDSNGGAVCTIFLTDIAIPGAVWAAI